MGWSRRQFCLGAGGLLLSSNGMAQELDDVDVLRPGRVTEVFSGDHFALEDGRRVRLAGIEAPRQAVGDTVAQPLSALAKATMEELVQDQQVAFTDPAPDRFGRLRAHVHVGPTQLWLQQAMLVAGLARVRTWDDDQAKAAIMLRLENTTRAAKIGIWDRAFYAVRGTDAISASTGSYQIVEGEVVDAAQSRKMIYLNFGVNWRQDFTAQATKKAAKGFSKAGVELSGLSGAQVRVRGTVRYSNGPVIWLNHPAQLELLEGG